MSDALRQKFSGQAGGRRVKSATAGSWRVSSCFRPSFATICALRHTISMNHITAERSSGRVDSAHRPEAFDSGERTLTETCLGILSDRR